MVKYLLIYILILFECTICYSQNITIQYLYKPDNFFTDSFNFKLYKPIDENVRSKSLEILPIKIDYSQNGDSLKAFFSYNISDTIIALLGEGWGHQIILMPIYDTLTIIIGTKIEAKPYYSSDSLLIPWQYRFEYKSRYKAIYQLFDSLDVTAGSTFFDRIGAKNSSDNIDVFFERCNLKYEKRIKFLNQYALQNDIPEGIKNLVYHEIKFAYLLNLVQALIPGINKLSNIQLPNNFFDSLKGYSFKDDYLFRKSKLYAKAAYQYAIFYLCKLSGEFRDKLDFQYAYKTIKQEYTGEIRNYCLNILLSVYISENNPQIDSLVYDFKTFCLDTNSIIYIDSLKSALIDKKNISITDALNTRIYNILNSEFSLCDLIKDKPVLIDCWASWCKPCLEEMVDSKILQKKYNGKVDFIYLSFDKNKIFWKMKSDELGLKNSYLISNDFENRFTYHFNIFSIPRYIIIDKNRKVVTSNAPRPSSKEEIEFILDNLF